MKVRALLLLLFYFRIIIQCVSMNDSFDCHGVWNTCKLHCLFRSLILGAFALKLAYSDCWHWKWCMRFFEGIGSFLDCHFDRVCLHILVIFGHSLMYLPWFYKFLWETDPFYIILSSLFCFKELKMVLINLVWHGNNILSHNFDS